MDHIDVRTLYIDGTSKDQPYSVWKALDDIQKLLDIQKINLIEYKNLRSLINSPDEENLYIAQQIIIQKANG